MYSICDSFRNPILAEDGRPLEGMTIDDAISLLAFCPDGQVINQETGAKVQFEWPDESDTDAHGTAAA